MRRRQPVDALDGRTAVENVRPRRTDGAMASQAVPPVDGPLAERLRVVGDVLLRVRRRFDGVRVVDAGRLGGRDAREGAGNVGVESEATEVGGVAVWKKQRQGMESC